MEEGAALRGKDGWAAKERKRIERRRGEKTWTDEEGPEPVHPREARLDAWSRGARRPSFHGQHEPRRNVPRRGRWAGQCRSRCGAKPWIEGAFDAPSSIKRSWIQSRTTDGSEHDDVRRAKARRDCRIRSGDRPEHPSIAEKELPSARRTADGGRERTPPRSSAVHDTVGEGEGKRPDPPRGWKHVAQRIASGDVGSCPAGIQEVAQVDQVHSYSPHSSTSRQETRLVQHRTNVSNERKGLTMVHASPLPRKNCVRRGQAGLGKGRRTSAGAIVSAGSASPSFVPDMQKRKTMNKLLAATVAVPSIAVLGPYFYALAPKK